MQVESYQKVDLYICVHQDLRPSYTLWLADTLFAVSRLIKHLHLIYMPLKPNTQIIQTFYFCLLYTSHLYNAISNTPIRKNFACKIRFQIPPTGKFDSISPFQGFTKGFLACGMLRMCLWSVFHNTFSKRRGSLMSNSYQL